MTIRSCKICSPIGKEQILAKLLRVLIFFIFLLEEEVNGPFTSNTVSDPIVDWNAQPIFVEEPYSANLYFDTECASPFNLYIQIE